MRHTLEKLSEMYEYIIIDSAPLGVVTDAKLLIEQSAVTLMTFRADYTDKEMIKEFDKMIAQYELEDTSVGIILNGVESVQLSYGYYGDYGKYGE
jgi:Mrp family chromosome partitioning ATPase